MLLGRLSFAFSRCVVVYFWDFLIFFWGVFWFWACWQVCDFVLLRLKVKLRKPWSFDSKSKD